MEEERQSADTVLSEQQKDFERITQDIESTGVDRVESMFRRAESQLDYMSRKLQDEFKEELGENNHLNPSEMMQRLQRVRSEYSAMVGDIHDIHAMQAEITTYYKTQLLAACSAAKSLLARAPLAPTESTDEQREVVEVLLGMDGAGMSTEGGDDAATCSGNTSEVSSVTSNSANTFAPFEPSPAEKRATCDNLILISEEEFESVSPLIRCRAKLADVNSVYRVLHEHCRQSKTSKYLTVQELTSMGMRITGATGEAKLKVLRSLKILHIAKNGAVKLL